MSALYAAEHRGLRELHAGARQLVKHWRRLAGRLDGRCAAVLEGGAAEAERVRSELARESEVRGVPGFPAASGAGARFAGLHNAGDLMLERNQAMRGAVLDVQWLVTLVAYLERLAATRGDDGLAALHADWGARLAAVEERARITAIELGSDPAFAVTPAETGALGRAGHRIAVAMGGAGEAVDGSAIGRAARRFAR